MIAASNAICSCWVPSMTSSFSMGALLGLGGVATPSVVQGKAPAISLPRPPAACVMAHQSSLVADAFAAGLFSSGVFYTSCMAHAARQQRAVRAALPSALDPRGPFPWQVGGPTTNVPSRHPNS